MTSMQEINQQTAKMHRVILVNKMMEKIDSKGALESFTQEMETVDTALFGGPINTLIELLAFYKKEMGDLWDSMCNNPAIMQMAQQHTMQILQTKGVPMMMAIIRKHVTEQEMNDQDIKQVMAGIFELGAKA